jgi:hypothetical protein
MTTFLPHAPPGPSPSKANPFARRNPGSSASFTRATLLPTFPSPQKATPIARIPSLTPELTSSSSGILSSSGVNELLATPGGQVIDARSEGARPSGGKGRQAWRLLWRGGLEIGRDGWRLEGDY